MSLPFGIKPCEMIEIPLYASNNFSKIVAWAAFVVNLNEDADETTDNVEDYSIEFAIYPNIIINGKDYSVAFQKKEREGKKNPMSWHKFNELYNIETITLPLSKFISKFEEYGKVVNRPFRAVLPLLVADTFDPRIEEISSSNPYENGYIVTILYTDSNNAIMTKEFYINPPYIACCSDSETNVNALFKTGTIQLYNQGKITYDGIIGADLEHDMLCIGGTIPTSKDSDIAEVNITPIIEM